MILRSVKPLSKDTDGSSPSLPIRNADVAHLVERQTSNLNVTGSIPVIRWIWNVKISYRRKAFHNITSMVKEGTMYSRRGKKS